MRSWKKRFLDSEESFWQVVSKLGWMRWRTCIDDGSLNDDREVPSPG